MCVLAFLMGSGGCWFYTCLTVVLFTDPDSGTIHFSDLTVRYFIGLSCLSLLR